MTGDDLIVAAPWLAFAAGLALIGWRLAASRGRRRHGPSRPGACGRPNHNGAGAGDRPARPGKRPMPLGTSVAQNGQRRNR